MNITNNNNMEEKRTEFSIEEYEKNPKRKIETRNGNPARIICVDRKHRGDCPFNVIALVDIGREEIVVKYTANGHYHSFPDKNSSDLLFASEEKEPLFKPGDVAITKNGSNYCAACISEHPKGYYFITPDEAKEVGAHLATPEEIKRWNEEELHPAHKHYSKDKRKIEYWFLPFDKVLVRDRTFPKWRCNIFSYYDKDDVLKCHYVCISGSYRECIPYNEKTAHLMGTKNNYEEEEL